MSERDLLIERGGHLKTRNLIEQASYTVKLAHEDFTSLQNAGLSTEFLTDVDSLIKEFTEMSGKYGTAKDDISLSTKDVNSKLTEAKDWIKKAKFKAKRTFRLNKTALNDFYTFPPVSRSVPNAIAAMTKLIELNKKYNAEMTPHTGGNAFAAEGEKILAELQDIDSTQEKIKTSLPQSTQDLYYKQGTLYYKLKDINDMGQEVFIGNRAKAGQYNMDILNRGGSKRKEQPAKQ